MPKASPIIAPANNGRRYITIAHTNSAPGSACVTLPVHIAV